jgi:hypothetical protein
MNRSPPDAGGGQIHQDAPVKSEMLAVDSGPCQLHAGFATFALRVPALPGWLQGGLRALPIVPDRVCLWREYWSGPMIVTRPD